MSFRPLFFYFCPRIVSWLEMYKSIEVRAGPLHWLDAKLGKALFINSAIEAVFAAKCGFEGNWQLASLFTVLQSNPDRRPTRPHPFN